jgi:hypothetical protein
MPREQRTNLVKGAAIEVGAGTFQSKPSGSVAMPFVSPKKSPGQALAEGIGLAAKGLAKIGQSRADEKGKQAAIKQRYAGMSAAKVEASKILKDLKDKKTPLSEYATKLSLALGGANDKLGEESDVSASYLEGYLGTLGKYLGKKQDDVQASIDADVLEVDYKNARQGMKEDVFVNGVSGVDALKSIQAALNLGNDDAAKWYISNMSALINQMSDEDINFDGQGAVDKYLKLTPEKGIVFADHPTYRALIETLEAELLAGKGSALKQQNLYAKQITKDVTSKAMSLILKVGAGPAELLEAEALVKANAKYMSGRELGTFVKLMRDLKQNGFAATSDPAVLFRAKQAAARGDSSFDQILALHPNLTSDDIGKVFQVKLDRDKTEESKKGSIFNTNVSRLISNSEKILNVMSGPDKFLDPVSGANRVQMFGDDFMLAVENYKVENDTLIVPSAELLKMRNEAQKNAQLAFPMNAMMEQTPVVTTPGEITTNERGDKVSSDLKPGKGTASNPIDPPEETSLVDDFLDLFND